jgi:hypothetical protein
LLGLSLLGACSESSSLPHQLWIGIDKTEANIQLVDREPDPF